MGYDDYYGKHSARFYGWLPASLEHKARLKGRPIKYFTLCAEEAIDIFMLEKEGILKRDANKELPNVFICEKENSVASKIVNLVRPPIKEAIFVGALDVILTFKEDKHTAGKDLDADDKNYQIRQKLYNRRLFHRLKNSFPFDIINFDPCGNLLDNNKDSNKRLMESLKKVFELQNPLDSFLMFVTIPLSDIHKDYIKTFKAGITKNVKDHPKIGEALSGKYGSSKYEDIEELHRIAIGFSKSVMTPIAKKSNWQCNHQGIYVYQNRDKRHMLSSVILLTKSQKFDLDIYVKDVLQIITEMPSYYPYSNPFGDQVIINNMKEVVEYRTAVKESFIEQ